MSDGNKTGDQGNQGNDQGNQTEMVSKSDYDKILSEVENLKSLTSKVNKELDEAKGELLSPEYIAYLESKQTGNAPKMPKGNVEDIENMSRTEFVQFLENGLKETLMEFKKSTIDPVSYSVQDLAAREEVRVCEKLYSDFNDYRQDMIEIVKKNQGINIEQAYKIAKSNKKIEKDNEEKMKAYQAANEKPGGPAGSTTHPVEFKDPDKAAEDAWEKTMGDKSTL